MATNKKISVDTTVVASKEHTSADLGGDTAILNLKSHVYYALDPVGAHIWNLIQSPRTVREIRDMLLKKYDVDSDRCESDLVELLEQLAQNDLIDVFDDR
jgi:hypothetical protein